VNDSQNWGEELAKAISDLIRASFWAALVYWVLSAFIAGLIAQDRGRSFFGFFATLFFLGPLGVGFALLANRSELDYAHVPLKRKVAEGRQRFTCPRCGAESDIPDTDTSYDCWRCGEHRKVKPKATAEKKS
jgi:DNA-directed RNA polymerase subunit RPC12/RpoP